jgi:hypothetical protein
MLVFDRSENAFSSSAANERLCPTQASYARPDEFGTRNSFVFNVQADASSLRSRIIQKKFF